MRFRQSYLWMTLAALVAGCGGDSPTGTGDTTAPARITDLAAGHGANGYFLTWTAPGDDDTTGTVSRYDIRRINGDITVHWGDATPLASPDSLVPAGRTQTAAIGSLGPGVWQFAVKAADEVPNWSDMSNTVSVTIVTPPEDTVPPAVVTDLAAEVTPEGVRLHWTAPGDDGLSGTAAVYDLRFAHEAITPQSWAAATPVEGVAVPKTSGEPESTTVTSLQIGREYSFALKSADEKGNWSGISNVATVYIPWPSPTQLTFNSTNCGAYSPHWSPDGSSIVCSMGVPGGSSCVSQIFVVPLDGGNPKQYTFSSYQAGSPAWSPDGTHFALSETDADGSKYRLAVMEATPRAAMTILASHSGLNVSRPRWSPDGTRIAYLATGGTPPSNLVTTLYSIPSDGGTPTALAGPFSNTGLTWSPDGTKIAYDSNESGSQQIWIMPSTGGTATQLTTGGGKEYSPSWSPDGAVIAYVHIAVGQSTGQIWGIAPTGGPSLLLVNDTGVTTAGLAWSPDGRSLAYTKLNPRYNIWVASVNVQQ